MCCFGRSAPAGAGLCLRCVVRCSLAVPALCVLLPVVMRVFDGAVLAAFLFAVLPLVPCLCVLSCGLVLRRRLRRVVALWCCGGIALLRRVLSCCFGFLWCVFCLSPWCGVYPRCGVPRGVARHPPCRVLCAVFFVLVATPLPTGFVALCCALSCVVSCGAAVCGVFCGLPGAVWRACVRLDSCAVLSGAVLCSVVLCCFCRVLLSCSAAFCAGFFFLRCSLPFCGALGCFHLCGALPWCFLLFGVASSRCAPLLVSAALCHFVLCCAMVRLLLLCCVVCFVAVLGSRLASSAVVAGCSALSVLGRGALVPCVVSLGASRFMAPLVRCCAGVPASLLSLRCSLAPVALAGVVSRCVWVFAIGPGCPLLSPGGSWWLLVSLFVVCCGVSLGAVLGRGAAFCRPALCCCALCCFVLLCLVLLRAVSCLGALSVVLGPFAFRRCDLSCLVVPCVFCRGVLLRAVVHRCALCRVLPGVSCCAFPVLSALYAVSVRPCSPLVPCSPMLFPCGAVLPFGAVVSCPAALFGLFPVFVWFLLLEELLQNLFQCFPAFENKIKLYTTQRTHTCRQQDHFCFTALHVTPQWWRCRG